MIYIIAGTLHEGFMYAADKKLSPREALVISSTESGRILRGRKWNEGDTIEWIGTYYEHDYSRLREELLIMGAPKELT